MKKHGIVKICAAFLTVMLILLAGCEGIAGEKAPKEDPGDVNAKLAALKINNTTVQLGTPAGTPENAAPGNAVQVSGTSTATAAVSATAAASGAKVAWDVTSADTPNYAGLNWGNTANISFSASGSYFLVVRVTSRNDSVIQYYKARIAVTISQLPQNAVKPVFTSHPASAAYNLGEDILLTAEAEVSDGGTVTYEWFYADDLTGEGDPDGTGPSYTPGGLPAGTYYFYVIATNTNNAATGTKTAAQESNRAVITVTSLVSAVKPVFTSHPASAIYNPGASIASLTVTTAVPGDGGTVSYEWFKASDAISTGSKVGSGASYSPGDLSAGAHYFYALATNTNNAATGSKTAAQESDRAVITVNLIMNIPQRNSSAVSAGNTGLFRIDLGADFDITAYTRFTIELAVYQQDGTTAISPANWNDIVQMQWEFQENKVCADRVSYPSGAGGNLKYDQDWRWDLVNVGPGQSANTNAAIPDYLFRMEETFGIDESPNPPPPEEYFGFYGSYLIEPLRYLYFKTAGSWNTANTRYLEVTRITFFAE